MPQYRGELFAPELVNELFNEVMGRSSLAVLSAQTPLSFNGNEFFTFNFDEDVEVVGEGGPKSHGGVTVGKKVIRPIKIQYSARFSDEFMIASEEEKIAILRAFAEGYARKVARGLDLMAFHGVNPKTMEASDIIGDNNFTAQVEQTVTFDAATADENIDDAVALVQANSKSVTGMALAPAAGAAISKIKVNGVAQYPEFRFGANPGALGGMKLDINETVSATGTNKAFIGDFTRGVRWGYAKQIPLEVIEYGDPDGTGRDLKAHNEVLLRSETYIGWAILEPLAFARITDGAGA